MSTCNTVAISPVWSPCGTHTNPTRLHTPQHKPHTRPHAPSEAQLHTREGVWNTPVWEDRNRKEPMNHTWPPTDPTLELRVAVRHLICALSGVTGKGHRWMNADTHRMCVRCLRTQYRPVKENH